LAAAILGVLAQVAVRTRHLDFLGQLVAQLEAQVFELLLEPPHDRQFHSRLVVTAERAQRRVDVEPVLLVDELVGFYRRDRRTRIFPSSYPRRS
jgi:hypothetical protein